METLALDSACCVHPVLATWMSRSLGGLLDADAVEGRILPPRRPIQPAAGETELRRSWTEVEKTTCAGAEAIIYSNATAGTVNGLII